MQNYLERWHNAPMGETTDFATATWHCSGCTEKLIIRYHVPTDGHPPNEAPDPWVSVPYGHPSAHAFKYYCPECGAPDVAEDFEENAVTECNLEAEQRYRKEHICYRCIHAAICRFAPNDEGQRLFVTVRRCREWVPAID